MSAFIIPRDTPGMTFHPYKNKLGFRPITTGEISLHDVRVGPEALLGEEGEGFRAAMTAVERGRLGVAARSVGVAQACLDDTVAYAREREVFGQQHRRVPDRPVEDHRHGRRRRDGAAARAGDRARRWTRAAAPAA